MNCSKIKYFFNIILNYYYNLENYFTKLFNGIYIKIKKKQL